MDVTSGTTRVVLYLLARQYLFFLGALMLWATAPLLLSWHGVTIVSGSMTPSVRIGDVLVYSPAAERPFLPGDIVVMHDPARPQSLLSHRVVRVEPDGSLITKGDANAAPDSTPVPASNVMGLGRLRIPWVGLPLLWLKGGNYLLLGALMGLTLAAGHVVALGKPALLRKKRRPTTGTSVPSAVLPTQKSGSGHAGGGPLDVRPSAPARVSECSAGRAERRNVSPDY